MGKKILLLLLTFLSSIGAVYGAEKVTKLKDGSELVYIQAGDFTMGSEERDYMGPPHKVKLNAFYIGRYEVTNAQYKKFCDEGKKKYPANPGWDSNYFLGKPGYPVMSITWQEAADYAKWAGGRLPTEAEWEYAARGGTNTYYYWGDKPSPTYLNYRGDDKWDNTSPVGSFPPNPFGLHDMLGNVSEWVADWYGEDYFKKSPVDNPKGPKKGTTRIIKGDSWGAGKPYGATLRDWRSPSNKSEFVGFRIAK